MCVEHVGSSWYAVLQTCDASLFGLTRVGYQGQVAANINPTPANVLGGFSRARLDGRWTLVDRVASSRHAFLQTSDAFSVIIALMGSRR